MNYEYGYTITVQGESRDTVLGTCGDAEVEAKRAECAQTNRMEQSLPNIKGLARSGNSVYWVRPVNVEPSASSQ